MTLFSIESPAARFEAAFLRRKKDIGYPNMEVYIDGAWEDKFDEDEWDDFHAEVGMITEAMCRLLKIPKGVRLEVEFVKHSSGHRVAGSHSIYPKVWYRRDSDRDYLIELFIRKGGREGFLNVMGHELEHLRQSVTGELKGIGPGKRKNAKGLVDGAIMVEMEGFENHGVYDLYVPNTVWRGEIYHIRMRGLSYDEIMEMPWWSETWVRKRVPLSNYLRYDGFYLVNDDGSRAAHFDYRSAPWEQEANSAGERLPKVVRKLPHLASVFESIKPKLRRIGYKLWDG